MAKPLYTQDRIIAAGEDLETETDDPVEAWQVFQALGGRGRFDRVRAIWEGHVAARSAAPATVSEELPFEVDAELSRALDVLNGAIRQLFIKSAANRMQDTARQLELVRRDYEAKNEKLAAEARFWREKALSQDVEDEETDDRPRPVQAEKPERKRAKRKPTSKPAVPKTENRGDEAGGGVPVQNDQGQPPLL